MHQIHYLTKMKQNRHASYMVSWIPYNSFYSFNTITLWLCVVVQKSVCENAVCQLQATKNIYQQFIKHQYP